MNFHASGKERIHYGWVIAFVGMLCMTASLGFGRFTLGMLLPSMSSELNLTSTRMGFISSANLCGYLVSALFIAKVSSRIGPRITIFLALIMTGTFMALATTSNSFIPLLVLNTAIGLCSAGASIPSMGLASVWFSKKTRGRAAGIVVAGSGIAIMIGGVLIPHVNRMLGATGWRTSWEILGAATAAIAFIAFALLKNRPADIGIAPHGECEETFPKATDACAVSDPGRRSIFRSRTIYHLGAIYFFFGLSYVIYTTFIVSVLVHDWGFPENSAGILWMCLGFLSIFSGPVFGALSDRFGRKAGFIMVFSLQTVAYLLIATKLPGLFLYLSVFLFGITAWSIPGIMAAAMGDYAGADKAVQALGLVTVILGFGQMSGPALAGKLAYKVGVFSTSFYLAALASCLAIILSFLLEAASENRS